MTLHNRYFCPDQGGSEYPKWVPQAVASGSCASTTREELSEAPLPPNFKVLFYGNSHLRQVSPYLFLARKGSLLCCVLRFSGDERFVLSSTEGTQGVGAG